MEDRLLCGRQIAFMIYEYFRVTGAHEAVLDYSDLFRIALHGDDIQDFGTRWDDVLLTISDVPIDNIRVSLYKMRIQESDQLPAVFAMYEQEINQNLSNPSYQKLKTMMKRQKDQKFRTRKFQARNERIKRGVLVKTRKGKNVSVEKEQGDCYQWKAKGQCTKGNARNFRHDENKGGQVTQPSSPAPRSQTHNVGKSSSKGKSPGGRSHSGQRYQSP